MTPREDLPNRILQGAQGHVEFEKAYLLVQNNFVFQKQ